MKGGYRDPLVRILAIIWAQGFARSSAPLRKKILEIGQET